MGKRQVKQFLTGHTRCDCIRTRDSGDLGRWETVNSRKDVTSSLKRHLFNVFQRHRVEHGIEYLVYSNVINRRNAIHLSPNGTFHLCLTYTHIFVGTGGGQREERFVRSSDAEWLLEMKANLICLLYDCTRLSPCRFGGMFDGGSASLNLNNHLDLFGGVFS